jgi:hypothetical protein
MAHLLALRMFIHGSIPAESIRCYGVARKFGLVYRLSPEMQAMYESIMTKLPGYNGDQSWELPLAATYVVQPEGKISWTRVDADWRHRPEPEELLGTVTDSIRKNHTD